VLLTLFQLIHSVRSAKPLPNQRQTQTVTLKNKLKKKTLLGERSLFRRIQRFQPPSLFARTYQPNEHSKCPLKRVSTTAVASNRRDRASHCSNLTPYKPVVLTNIWSLWYNNRVKSTLRETSVAGSDTAGSRLSGGWCTAVRSKKSGPTSIPGTRAGRRCRRQKQNWPGVLRVRVRYADIPYLMVSYV
jgi:hypothetical protein